MSTANLSTPFPGGIRLLARIAIAVVVVFATLGIGADAQASAPACTTTWGSLQESADATRTGSITGVHHDSGIVFLPDGRQYVLVLLSKELGDFDKGTALLASVSEMVYNYIK